MFTENDRKTKNWRSQQRALRKARRLVKRIERKLKDKRYDSDKDKALLKNKLTETKVRVSVLELKVGDKPE